jgi:subtilisin family serine protease
MKKFTINANILFLTLILTSYIFTPIIGIPLEIKSRNKKHSTDLDSNQLEDLNNPITADTLTTTKSKSAQLRINGWEDMILNFDKNKNGIDDKFDKDLNYLESSENKEKSNSLNEITFVIRFPDNYDYTNVLEIFKNNEGNIKYTYKYAINGFSGRIDFQSLIIFCDQLRDKNIQFFLEEDVIGNTKLYYTSRNLRLRPYVWNTLNFTGDNTSAIAILDTGIDEDHEFFDNQTTGKIIAWVDFTENGENSTAYDDNGHGSHVAGIAAGLGTSSDIKDRAVASDAQNVDYTGILIDDGDASDEIYFSRFDVPSYGEIEIECTFNDSTPGLDYTLADFYLASNGVDLAHIGRAIQGDWKENITFNIASSSQLGDYYVYAIITYRDGGVGGICRYPNSTISVEIHWPFTPSEYGSGNLWKGVAPNANLVGVKVVNRTGGGRESDVIKGVDWCVENRQIYNISVISMSLGYYRGYTALIDAVDNAVESGIVVVVSAGNEFFYDLDIQSPGDADKVITVAANTFDDQITEYSSEGGLSYYGNTNKPDITAPGGSFNDLQIFSADTNDNDGKGVSPDEYNNDLYGAQGTSMSCPVVAGAANLLIQAIKKDENWDWTSGSKSKLVKAILLMTATETYPLERLYFTSYSPSLNRGGKDVHEGYGRLNIDAAIEAWTNNLTSLIKSSTPIKPSLESSKDNPNGKHAYAGFINMQAGETYEFSLVVPEEVDYDLYLYNSTPNQYGEPILLASGISDEEDDDENFSYTASHSGKFFLVVKAIYFEEDKDDDEEIIILDLTLILIIIAVIALIGIIIIIIIYKKSKSDYNYEYSPEY